MDVGRWGRTTTAVPADAISPPRSRSLNSRNVASRALRAFFMVRPRPVVLRRCIVGLLRPLPHRAAADRPKLVAATREDERGVASARGDAEEEVARLVACRLDDPA